MKKKTLLKIFVSIIILCLLLTNINFAESMEVLSKFNIKIFILTVIIYITGQIISAVKWEIISQQLGFKSGLFDYIKYYFKGMFYNTFLPTNVGGDIMKVYYLSKTPLPRKNYKLQPAIISVLTDRISGVLVLIFLAFFGSFTIQNILLKYCIWSGLAVTILLFCITGIICKFASENHICKQLIYYSKAFFNKSLLKIFTLSLIFHALVIIIHILLGHALNLHINPTYYLILYPLTAIIASLPITLNGIGIKEAGYIYLLNQISIAPSESIVFVLCWNLVVLFSSLSGAVFFIEKKSL